MWILGFIDKILISGSTNTKLLVVLDGQTASQT